MEGLDASLRAARATRAKLDAALDAQLAGLERRVAAVKEKWREASEAAAAPTGPLPETLEINVGGDTSVAVSREAMVRTPSRLAQMFSGRWDHVLPRDSDGRFFLDLDNHQMRAIFDWLTELSRVGPDRPPPQHPRELLPDKHKWGLNELLQYLRLLDSHLQGPISSEVVEGGVQQVLAPQQQDEHGVSGAAQELRDQVASCALQAEKAEEEVRAKRAALEEERAFVESYAAAFRTGGAIVPLNVSGARMAAARATLVQEPESMLAAKFGPTWRLQDQELVDGGVFLDADPAAFAHVLQHLRLSRLGVPPLGPLPPQVAEGELLPKTLDYYGINSLKHRRLHESAITTYEQQVQLAAWLPQGARLELLFRASRDGFEAAAFHARCDDRGATLVVALSAGGHRFGGFSDALWTSAAGYTACTGSFLFRLHGPQGEPPARCALKAGKGHHGIYCSSENGPTFGGGNDLVIQSGTGSCQCEFNNMGWSYELPPDEATTLAEAHEVTLTEYEVFRII